MNETFDCKTAAKHWSEGKIIEWSYSGKNEWKEVSAKTVTFYKEGIDYRLRTEPVEPVRWARGAYYRVDQWFVSDELYSSFAEMKKGYPNQTAFFPARFDSEGFLIIPPEFQHPK